MPRLKKYATDQERKAAWREMARNWDRCNRSERASITRIVHRFDEEEPVIVPPEVRAAQRRRIDFMVRAVTSGRITPNQYLLGEPVKSRSVSSSLSQTEIYAILG